MVALVLSVIRQTAVLARWVYFGAETIQGPSPNTSLATIVPLAAGCFATFQLPSLVVDARDRGLSTGFEAHGFLIEAVLQLVDLLP